MSPPPRRATGAFVEALRERTTRLRRRDNVLGGGDTYHVYLAEYQVTKALLRSVAHTEDVGHRLLSLLAEQAQQAGWAAFDAGRDADAVSLYKESHAAAREADDTDLLGNSLAFLAYQSIEGDRRAAVEIAESSCRSIGPTTPSGVKALLNERMAWTCAMAGRLRQTERALATATACARRRA